jgi:hypothetical protein
MSLRRSSPADLSPTIVGQSVLGMVLALLMRLALPAVRLSVGAVVAV